MKKVLSGKYGSLPALLLVVVIIFLNLAAIAIRNRLREKYRALEH